MNRFTFFLNVEGHGDTARDAWEHAMEKLAEAILRGEFQDPPETIYKGDEPIEAAELLNGPAYPEFGIDHGDDI